MPDVEPEEKPDKPVPKKPAPKRDWVTHDKLSKRIDQEVSDARGGE